MAAVAAMFFVLFFAAVWLLLSQLAGFSRTETTDRTDDWRAFYRDEVAHSFFIPHEAEIVEAEEYRDPIMGGGFYVEFKLPSSKSPEQWLSALLSGPAKELKRFRKSKFEYDGSGKIGDMYWLRYLPARRTYVARWHWD